MLKQTTITTASIIWFINLMILLNFKGFPESVAMSLYYVVECILVSALLTPVLLFVGKAIKTIINNTTKKL